MLLSNMFLFSGGDPIGLAHIFSDGLVQPLGKMLENLMEKKTWCKSDGRSLHGSRIPSFNSNEE